LVTSFGVKQNSALVAVAHHSAIARDGRLDEVWNGLPDFAVSVHSPSSRPVAVQPVLSGAPPQGDEDRSFFEFDPVDGTSEQITTLVGLEVAPDDIVSR